VHVEGTCCANGEGRQLAHRARIRRDRGNHEYENVRQEQLQAERLDGAAARNGRTQVCAQPLDRLAEVGNMWKRWALDIRRLSAQIVAVDVRAV